MHANTKKKKKTFHPLPAVPVNKIVVYIIITFLHFYFFLKKTQISFIDYICYIPLFLSMHENIVDNPLDMSDSKYDKLVRKPSGHARQRDLNPLGQPLSKSSTHFLRQDARDLLEGKITVEDIRPVDRKELVTKYSK